ncbi:Uncharacterised protein [Listeria welshimeri]|nr:Uncharacterised protein [Listeria welshimeri]
MAEKNIWTNKIICTKAILFLLSIGISYLLFFKVFFLIYYQFILAIWKV